MTNNNDRWNSQHYKKNSQPQFEGALSALANYPFKGDETILDIGCGDGKITAEIAELAPHGTVLGIDISPNMIEQSKKSFFNIPNLTFQIADAMAFLTDAKFDIIVSFFTFHYIADQESVLKHCYQFLKPNGMLIIQTSGAQQPEIAEVFGRESWKKQFPMKQETWHGKDEDAYKTMLASAGFKDFKIKTTWESRFFDNEEKLLQWAMAWVPYVTGFSGDKALEFGKALIENICAHQPKGGKIELRSPIVSIEARK